MGGVVLKIFLFSTFVLHFTFASVLVEGVSNQATFSLEDEDFLQFIGSFQSGDLLFDKVIIDEGSFATIRSEGYHSSMLIGFPELPELHRLIELPQGTIPRIEILEEEEVLSWAEF